MTNPEKSGQEIMQEAVAGLERTVEAANAVEVSKTTVSEVADGTFRTIADDAFVECDISSGECKFYGPGGLSICDRSCDIPVWDQI